MLHIPPRALASLLCLLAAAAPISAQIAPQPPLPDSRFADLGGLRLEYFEFGTPSGPSMVYLQDFHDYFRLEEADDHRAYLQRFGDRYRVIAPVRRGFGASDDPHWGFDVATQGQDIIRLLNALNIRQAVLVGRVPATQEMTYLAEHHPERLAGLAYLDAPMVMNDMRDPEIRAWSEAFWKGSCDLGDRAVAIAGPRAAWQPDFLTDTTLRVAVPTLMITIPAFAGGIDERMLAMLPRVASQPACAPGVQAYYRELAADSTRLASLRNRLARGDRTADVRFAMQRAFGSAMTPAVVNLTMSGDPGDMLNQIYTPIRAFLDELAAKGVWR